MKRTVFYLTAFFIGLVIWGCSKSDSSTEEDPSDTVQQLYFPPLSSAAWETVSPAELEWNLNAETPLQDLLEERGTKAFLMLKDGKIAVEWYFDSFTKDSIWYWASAGKTLTAFTVGLAQEQGFLNLSDRSSQYLGEGWTSAPLEKENLITVRDQLTMSSGLNELFFDCVSPDCLRYLADSGSRWAYHNGPYTLLQQVVANATQLPYSSYFNTELRNKVGMDGFWLSTNGQNNVYFSTARSMARFGLLSLNSGTWEEEVIMSDTAYANEMKNSSQDQAEACNDQDMDAIFPVEGTHFHFRSLLQFGFFFEGQTKYEALPKAPRKQPLFAAVPGSAGYLRGPAWTRQQTLPRWTQQ